MLLYGENGTRSLIIKAHFTPKLGWFKDKSGLFPDTMMFVMSKRGLKKGLKATWKPVAELPFCAFKADKLNDVPVQLAFERRLFSFFFVLDRLLTSRGPTTHSAFCNLCHGVVKRSASLAKCKLFTKGKRLFPICRHIRIHYPDQGWHITPAHLHTPEVGGNYSPGACEAPQKTGS